ncbi:MAG: ATP-binding protein [Candidatus Eisenbacteria bacterium]|nr:ATP-binding protein [Candidatus Eisenbacteria bacterium]
MNASRNSSIKLIIPGSLEFLRVVDRVSDTVADYVGFDEDEKNAIAISVIEASTNAIQHGCGCSDAKHVILSYQIEENLLRVTVLDPGAGFDPSCVKCQLDEAAVESRGRGLAIIKSLMDEVVFEFEGGTSVTMVKRKGSASEKTGT